MSKVADKVKLVVIVDRPLREKAERQAKSNGMTLTAWVRFLTIRELRKGLNVTVRAKRESHARARR